MAQKTVMRVEVLFFAQLKEAAGKERLSLDVEEGTRVQDLVTKLMKEPNFSQCRSLPLVYAVNETFEGVEKELADQDRLAIMTPVSGG